MTDDPLLLDSITDAASDAKGRVAVAGSHGGLYPAAVASRAGLRAAIFNDAGIGRDRAGVAGVEALARLLFAAAAVDRDSACIGDAADMLRSGRISVANEAAARLGVEAGMSCGEAARRLKAAKPPTGVMDPVPEARRTAFHRGATVILVDSASLVRPEDEGALIVTGSHGGLIGGDPARALKAKARFAAFNDAGFGKNRIGASRLPALDDRGVAAVVVACASARIGDAASALETGVVSAANRAAAACGVAEGMTLSDALVAAAGSG